MRILRRQVRRYLAQKIYRRIILNYVGLGVLPIVIVSIVLINLTQRTVLSYLNQRNLEAARRASNEISLFIEEPLTILNTLVQTRDILEMERFTQSRVINKIKIGNPIFRKIFVLDQSGLAVVTTSFGEELKDYSKEVFFREVLKGKTYFSPVYFTPSRLPAILVSVPILKYDRVEGALVGEIDLKNIWELVDNITIGKTGNAFLLSAEGTLIAHRDKERVLQRESYANYDFFKLLREGKEGITRYQSGGRTMVAAYVPIPQLNWGIVIQQTEMEALELAREMRMRVIIFVALTSILALALAITNVKRITRPLEILVRGVREYAGGNLKHRIEIKRQDELGELAQEFNSMAATLDKNQRKLRRMEQLAALSRFASLVSHEIRNPLNSMNINMQILRRLIFQKNPDSEKTLKYLNVISSEIERINNLVTNFLVISRPPELNFIRTNIHQILEEVIVIQEGRAHAEGIEIHREYAKEELSGLLDHNQLKQVFHNIIINAFEAMRNGGTLEIATELIRKNNKDGTVQRIARIKFKDSGSGIPTQYLKDIFEFYYTTKRTGTGLGLAIAKQIVEGHKGKIYIQSQENRGTTVFIEIPLEVEINS